MREALQLPASSVLLIGPTGSGKTPFGNYLERYGIRGKRCFHFDFGQELRNIALNDSLPEGFDHNDQFFIRDVLEKGLLLENEHFYIAGKIIHNFLTRKGFSNSDMLALNGLPRHTDQAKDMSDLVKIESLIILECEDKEVFARIQNNTGGDRTERYDDSFEMIRKKLEIFNKRTSRLIDFYSASGSDIFRIKVTGSSSAEQLYSEFLRL
ncbi:MAG: nucleoside monophosphate kinase [Nitrospirota bacterium]